MYELQVKCKCLSCGSTLGSENSEEVYFSCELCKDVSKEVAYKEMLDLRDVKAWCSIKSWPESLESEPLQDGRMG